jgi:hypothetical protein
MSETDMTDYAELREEKAATPHNELIAQLLDSRVPKSEREHAAAREIERLRDALKGLITWIPSADTYRRLGFDPDAPMRALAKARAVLAKEAGND